MIRNLFGGSKCRTIDVCDIFGDGSGKALYRLDGNANDTGGNYHGTETAITYGGGVYERCGVFNGSSSYITTAYTVPAISTLSMSCWIKTTSVGTRQAIIADWDGGNNFKCRLTISLYDNSTFYVAIGNGASQWVDTSIAVPASVYDGNYHHIAYTISGTSVKIYVDNILINTYTSTVALGTIGTIPCYIGKLGTFAGYYFNGSIDQVRIFNRAITASEVTVLYNECAPTSTVDNVNPFEDGSLKALYQFNGDATDKTGVYNGTATNVTYATGKFGNCGIFDGSTSYVTTPITLASLPTNFSINLWAYITTSGTYQWIYGSFQSGVGYFGFSKNELEQTAILMDVTGATTLVLGTNLALNKFHMLTLTFNGTSLMGYLNGKYVGAVASSKLNITQLLTFGARSSDLVNKFNGKIDQTRIFNKALTPMEVASLYNETTPLEEPMHSLVDPFKDGSGKALYRLDGNALDESGNYNGTATSVTYGAGRFGRCGVFNGSSSSITSGYTALASSVISFSCWVNTTTTVGTKAIFWDGTGSAATTRGAFGFEGTKFAIFIGNGSTGWFDNSTVDISGLQNGAWHHIAVVISGTSVQFYKDGSLTYTYTSTVALGTAGSTPYYIGKIGSSASGYFNGSLDQVRVFNRILTASEVQTLYTEI